MPGTMSKMSIQENEQTGMMHPGKRSRVSFSQRQLQELERTFVHQRLGYLFNIHNFFKFYLNCIKQYFMDSAPLLIVGI